MNPGQPGAAPGGKLALIKRHKTAASLGAIGLVGGAAVLYERHKSASSSSGSAAAGTDSTSGAGGTSTYTDTSGDYNSLESQLANLQSSIAAGQATEDATDNRQNALIAALQKDKENKPKPKPKRKPKVPRRRHPGKGGKT